MLFFSLIFSSLLLANQGVYCTLLRVIFFIQTYREMVQILDSNSYAVAPISHTVIVSSQLLSLGYHLEA